MTIKRPIYFDHETGLSDDELVLEIARGSSEAFEAFHRRFVRDGLRFLRTRLQAEDAQDVLQEAFLQVWRRARTYDPARGSAGAWFFSIIRTRCLDRLRCHTYSSLDAQTGYEQIDSLEEHRILNLSLVNGLLQHLDRKRSRVLQLTYYGGMTHTETAHHLRAPLGTVKSQIRSGLHELRHILEKPRRLPMVCGDAI